MDYLKILIIIIIGLNINELHSQKLKEHEWKKRILLVLTDDINNTIYKNQIQELKDFEVGLTDRKLIVYHLLPAHYKKGLNKTKWRDSPLLYQEYKSSGSNFEIVLIGLDGKSKLRNKGFLSCTVLFHKIDIMPIRQSEMRKH